MSGLTRLGNISPAMIRRRFTPSSSVAFTKSRSETSRVAARITRATCGACERPTARMTSHSFGPTMDTSSSANTSWGKARSTSTVRMMSPSGRPWRYPAAMPLAVPIDTPIAVAAAAISRSTHPPSSTRESTSRPRMSPPRRACLEGSANGATMLAVAEWGATKGPTTATATTRPRTPRPNLPLGSDAAWRRMAAHPPRRRAGSAGAVVSGAVAIDLPGQAAARGGEEGHDVRDDVDEDVEAREEQDDHLDHRHVAVGHGVDQALPDAREGEHILHDHDPPGQVEEGEPEDLDDRRDGVGQGVHHDDAPHRHPLEPGHLDVVRRQGFDHRRPRHPGDVGHGHDDERGHGE